MLQSTIVVQLVVGATAAIGVRRVTVAATTTTTVTTAAPFASCGTITTARRNRAAGLIGITVIIHDFTAHTLG